MIDNPAHGLWDGEPTKAFALAEDSSLGRERRDSGEEFGYISDVAVDSKGRMVVLDLGNVRVIVCSPDGTTALTFGDAPNELRRPEAIAVDSNDRIYIADMGGRVAVYSPAGEFVEEFRQVIRDEFVRGMRITTEGLYISVFDIASKKVVHWYDSWHHYSSSFSDSWSVVENPPPCRGADRLAQGGAIDVDRHGFIYYTQFTPYEIRKFAPDGTLVLTIRRENDYQRPRIDCYDDGAAFYNYAGSYGILVASDGRLMNVVHLISDDYQTSGTLVDLFDADGRFLASDRLGRWTSIHCLDGQDRIIASEGHTVLVRYRLTFN